MSGSGMTHHRHPQHPLDEEDQQPQPPPPAAAAFTTTSTEESSLLLRHLSMSDDPSDSFSASRSNYRHSRKTGGGRLLPSIMDHQATDNIKMFLQHHHHPKSWLVLGGAISLILLLLAWIGHEAATSWTWHDHVLSIEHAVEHELQVEKDGNIRIWYRTWGNPENGGIPVLFVHGGPGNAIADYGKLNAQFFSKYEYFVVEIDQRGTGKSQPSVRDDWKNMKYYKDISIDQIGEDFEKVRQALGVEKWLVFGGSFGSTVSINYGTRYPDRCLGLILRGIYLDTEEEVSTVYSQSTYRHIPKRLAEFNLLYEYAVEHSGMKDNHHLDPDDAEALLRAYEHMIQSGDRYALWHWHVFENNLMEEDPNNLLDPEKIDKTVLPEAQSIAFFETRLWLHGSYEDPPSNLLDRIDRLTGSMSIWICQGRRDEVCPAKYARKLVDALDDHQAMFSARFLQAGHEASGPVMKRCLQDALYEFHRDYDYTIEIAEK